MLSALRRLVASALALPKSGNDYRREADFLTGGPSGLGS